MLTSDLPTPPHTIPGVTNWSSAVSDGSVDGSSGWVSALPTEAATCEADRVLYSLILKHGK